jgi:AcrR family transcriptional regulator
MPPVDLADPIAAALDMCTRQGYGATTVAEIADAAGMSRSTFFRRFGSKDDVLFHDQELLLLRVEEHLAATTARPLEAVCTAIRMVFDHHVARREVSVPRSALVRSVPALRDREIVTSHRYQNAVTAYLRRTLPESPQRDFGALAFAAAAIAVHNSVLARWLLDPDRDGAAELTAELRALVAWYAPALEGTRSPARVVAVSVDPGAGDAEILEAIRVAGIR